MTQCVPLCVPQSDLIGHQGLSGACEGNPTPVEGGEFFKDPSKSRWVISGFPYLELSAPSHRSRTMRARRRALVLHRNIQEEYPIPLRGF